MSTDAVLEDVRRKIAKHDVQFGRADDMFTATELMASIEYEAASFKGHIMAEHYFFARERFLKIAAIAVRSIESLDARNPDEQA